MNKTCEELITRRVTLADGRYLILYSFVTLSPPISPEPPATETQSKVERQSRNN